MAPLNAVAGEAGDHLERRNRGGRIGEEGIGVGLKKGENKSFGEERSRRKRQIKWSSGQSSSTIFAVILKFN